MNKLILLLTVFLPTLLFAQSTTFYNLGKARKNPEQCAKLYLKDKGLTKFPGSICLLTSMIELDVSWNAFDSLPSCLSTLSKLEKLNIYGDNNFKEFPEEITAISSLKWLTYSNSKSYDLPASIGTLSNLEYLDLQGTVTNIPSSFSSLNNLKSLVIYVKGVTSLPSNFGNLPAMEDIYVNGGSLTELPESIGSMRMVKKAFFGSRLKSLPNAIGKLTNLEDLMIHGSDELVDLPSSFKQLLKLKKL